MAGFAFPLFTEQMYTGLGYQWVRFYLIRSQLRSCLFSSLTLSHNALLAGILPRGLHRHHTLRHPVRAPGIWTADSRCCEFEFTFRYSSRTRRRSLFADRWDAVTYFVTVQVR